MTRFDFVSGIATSCVITAVGICFFALPIESVQLLGLILGGIGVAAGLVRLLIYLLGRGSFEITLPTLVIGVISLACGMFLLLWPDVIFEVVKVTLAVWFALSGGVQFITLYTYIVTGQKGWWPTALTASLNMFFCLLIALLPDAWSWLLSTIIAANFVLYGATEFIRLMLLRSGAKRKIRSFSLPVIIESRIAEQTLDSIKQIIRSDGDESYITSQNQPTSDPLDVEVLVHLSELAGHTWGHVDLAAGGMVFTYGNYDRAKENRRFFGLLWDGVLALTERDPYVKFSIDTVRKTIISYKLNLGDADRKALGENIRLLLHDCTPWEPDKKSTYAGALTRQGAHLFKFRAGLFHTYFGLNANCALLTRMLLDGTAAPRPRANGGPITPGAVLVAYENEYKRPGGCILERNVYVSNRTVKVEKEKHRKNRRVLADLKAFIDRQYSIKKMKR